MRAGSRWIRDDDVADSCTSDSEDGFGWPLRVPQAASLFSFALLISSLDDTTFANLLAFEARFLPNQSFAILTGLQFQFIGSGFQGLFYKPCDKKDSGLFYGP